MNIRYNISSEDKRHEERRKAKQKKYTIYSNMENSGLQPSTYTVPTKPLSKEPSDFRV